ncbi:MAG: hypothetical protein ACE5FD_03575 [Anaerolineae bacterium]
MNITEARQQVKRLLNERRFLVGLEEVLAIAEEAEADREGLVKEIKDLAKHRDELKLTVSSLQAAVKDERARLQHAEAEFDDRNQTLAAELEHARNDYASALKQISDSRAEIESKASREHEAFMTNLAEQRSSAEQQLASINQELEAVRRKMTGLLANG